MPVRIGLMAALTALLLALIVPGTTNASSGTWGYTVLKNSCTNSGGAFGYGKNVLTIQMYETGVSGVGQFNARAIEQVYSSGAWHQLYAWDWSATNTFGFSAKNHYWTYGQRFDFGTKDLGHRHRMLIKMIFGNYTAYPVGTPKKASVAC